MITPCEAQEIASSDARAIHSPWPARATTFAMAFRTVAHHLRAPGAPVLVVGGGAKSMGLYASRWPRDWEPIRLSLPGSAPANNHGTLCHSGTCTSKVPLCTLGVANPRADLPALLELLQLCAGPGNARDGSTRVRPAAPHAPRGLGEPSPKVDAPRGSGQLRRPSNAAPFPRHRCYRRSCLKRSPWSIRLVQARCALACTPRGIEGKSLPPDHRSSEARGSDPNAGTERRDRAKLTWQNESVVSPAAAAPFTVNHPTPTTGSPCDESRDAWAAQAPCVQSGAPSLNSSTQIHFTSGTPDARHSTGAGRSAYV